MSGGSGETAPAAVPFPSQAWFERLAELMNASRSRQEQLGYVDCVADFRVLDGAEDGGAFTVRVTFEEFDAVDVRRVGPEQQPADFVLEASLDAWREMIESIARGGGRPDLEQTLNRLSHMGTPFRVHGEDPLGRDLYFRYNQSLQEFVNASGSFSTSFPSHRVAATG